MANKIISKLVIALVSACLLSSCAAVHDFSTIPYVGIDNGNFRYERTVECSISNAYLFGLGGFNDDNLLDELKKEACLQDGEVLVNVNIQKTVSSYLGFIESVRPGTYSVT